MGVGVGAGVGFGVFDGLPEPCGVGDALGVTDGSVVGVVALGDAEGSDAEGDAEVDDDVDCPPGPPPVGPPRPPAGAPLDGDAVTVTMTPPSSGPDDAIAAGPATTTAGDDRVGGRLRGHGEGALRGVCAVASAGTRTRTAEVRQAAPKGSRR